MRIGKHTHTPRTHGEQHAEAGTRAYQFKHTHTGIIAHVLSGPPPTEVNAYISAYSASQNLGIVEVKCAIFSPPPLVLNAPHKCLCPC